MRHTAEDQEPESSAVTSEDVHAIQQDEASGQPVVPTSSSKPLPHPLLKGGPVRTASRREPGVSGQKSVDRRHRDQTPASSKPEQPREQQLSDLLSTSQITGPFGGPLGGSVPVLADSASAGSHHDYPDKPEPSKPSYAAAIPLDEAGRNATVSCLAGPEEEEDPVLHSLCELVTRLLSVPIAGVSLVETNCQRFHAMAGMPRMTWARELSFCAWTLQAAEPEVLVIENLTVDARSKEHPAVVNTQREQSPMKQQPMRFYAGAPLVASNGYRLGALCVYDVKAQKLVADQLNVLSNLAELVVRQLEKDHLLKLQKLENQGLMRSLKTFNQGLMLVDVARPGWEVLHVNEAWSMHAGGPASAALGRPFWDSFIPVQETLQQVQARMLQFQEGQGSFLLQVEPTATASQRSRLLLKLMPAGSQTVVEVPREPGAAAPTVGIPSSVGTHPTAAASLFFVTVVERDQADLNASILSTASTVDYSIKQTGSATGRLPLEFEEITLGVLIRSMPSGRLYRGVWNKEPVTVKVMERFVHECQPVAGGYVPEEVLLSCGLAHPSLVRGYRYATRTLQGTPATQGEPWVEAWLVEESCDMGTLSAAMLRGLFLEPGTRKPCMLYLLKTVADVAGALACLHAEGYLHGDISGDSVWLSQAPNSRGFMAKLRDFGLQPELHTNMLPLTAVTHAAPELVSQGVVSPAGDIYALGTIMWELAHQQRMWHNWSLAAVRERVGRRKQQPTFSHNLPELFTGLAKMCLAAEPSERPSAKALQRALHKFAREDERRLHRTSSEPSAELSPPSSSQDLGQATGLSKSHSATLQPRRLPDPLLSSRQAASPAEASPAGDSPAAPQPAGGTAAAKPAGGVAASLQRLCCCRVEPV